MGVGEVDKSGELWEAERSKNNIPRELGEDIVKDEEVKIFKNRKTEA